MDKRKISQDVYDRYVDATVALFMEYYCVALSEDIHKEIVEKQAEDKAFPDALDARCRAAIKKEVAVRKRRKCFKSIVKGLRYVAAVAIVLLALASVLFVSVEAIRVPIINYFVSLDGDYLEISQSSNVQNNGTTSGINWNDPLAGLIPQGYVLSMQKDNLQGDVTAIYDNADKYSIFFTSGPISNIKRVDAENAQDIRDIQIHGYDGVLVANKGIITIVWGDDVLKKSFSITASGLTENDVITIAEHFIELIAQQ